MDQEKKTEIIRTLNERSVTLPCPRCGNPSFTLIDGYFNEMIQPNTNTLNTLNIGGPSIPSIITACTRCGYLSQHALGALGLLPNNNEKKEEQKKSGKE